MSNIDKIRQEIERRMHICDGVFERNSDTYYQGKAVAYQETLSFIDSLQQEQPAKRGYKDCNGCEYNRLLKDQIGWQFRGCFGGDYKGKPIAEIELCPLKVAKQEQPSEELEEEIKRYIPRDQCPVPDLMEAVARHFANWQKEQMLKDAVEGRVFMSFAPGHNQMVMADVDLPTNTKVRVIVLKAKED